MERTHLHRVDDPSASTKPVYTRFQHPFAGFPSLRSHIHPHLVIFNLGDKIMRDADAASYLIFHPDLELRAIAQDALRIYEIWMEAQPRRAAGFSFHETQAKCPGYCTSDGEDSEDVQFWDILRPRSSKISSSSPSMDYMLRPKADFPDDESVDTLDSGNICQIDWWVRPSTVDKLWLEDVRQWQASSAAGDYEYNAPWEDQISSPVLAVSDPFSNISAVSSDSDASGRRRVVCVLRRIYFRVTYLLHVKRHPL